MADEIWKTIEDYPNYEVSNQGSVRNKNKQKYLKPCLDKTTGYMVVNLYDSDRKPHKKFVHRLVAEAFIPNPENKRTVNHEDTDKTNNVDSNLSWATDSENMLHAFEHGLCENTRSAAVMQQKELAKKPRTEKQIEAARRTIAVNTCNWKRKPFLYDYQMDAVKRLKNGNILCGGVGSGKSRTGLFYYFKENGGWIDENGYVPMKNPQDLYVITTAKKRNSLEWLGEMCHFLMYPDSKDSLYRNKIVVDSWNNLHKYQDVEGAFFLLDEQRLVSYGAWTKAFLKIAKHNKWIMLTATPGDTYYDYLPLFLANGFFRNKTEFTREHVVYSRYTKYPKIDRYVNTGRLDRLRRSILVQMDYKRKINAEHEDIYCKYDISKYKDVARTRTDPFQAGYIPCLATDEGSLLIGTDISIEDVSPVMSGWNYTPIEGDYVKLANKPIINASGLCYIWRKIVNSDESRQIALLELLEDHPKAIIFYNHNYELEILRNLGYSDGTKIAEYNGQKHQDVPNGPKWVYLCQYNAACEGWECIKTDTIIFYSQNYSYKMMTQAAGRIDRLNTPYDTLHYYYLKSRSSIDLAISKALREKRNFNENRYVNRR